MRRSFQIAVLVAALAPVLAAQRGPKASRPVPPPARPSAARPNAAGRLPGNAPRLNNPANPVQRLLRMTPEQRDRALEKLPSRQQARIRERLERFDSLPPAEKERRLRQLEMWSNLPPEKQSSLRDHIRIFNSLPDARRLLLRREIGLLRRLPEQERRTRAASEDFRTRYTPLEQQMLADLAENYPFPGR